MNRRRTLFYFVLLLVFPSLPLYTGVYLLNVMDIILIYLALALSWDMLLRSGQISFGMAGFFGMGGYGAALLFLNTGVHPLVSFVLGGLLAGVLAWLIGSAVLQLRGMYIAIVTLALAEIFRVIVMNLPALTGGPEGTILPQAIFAGNSTYTYWLVLTAAALSVAVSEVCRHTRIHFAVTSIRNDEIVAKSSGIDVFKYLVFLFAVTSAIQGITGGAYAHIYGFVSPEGSCRAPWIVFGVMRIESGVSPGVTPGEVLFTLLGFSLLYAALMAADLYLLSKFAKAGLHPPALGAADEPELGVAGAVRA